MTSDWPQNGKKAWLYKHHLFKAAPVCMCAAGQWVGPTPPYTHMDMNTNYLWTTHPTERCVLVSLIILIVNTLTWYVQKTSRTVSLSNQHLITFNVCVCEDNKGLDSARMHAHLQHHRVGVCNFGWRRLSSSNLPLPLKWCNICPSPENLTWDMTVNT